MINYISTLVDVLVELLGSDILFPFVGLYLAIWVARLVFYIINGGFSKKNYIMP